MPNKQLIIVISILLLLLALQKALHAETLTEVEFSEISLKNSSQDFIKLKINSPLSEKIEINDDKIILEISPEQITSEKEIIIYFKSGIEETKSNSELLEIHTTKKGLTATTEQITITQANNIIDIVCWQNSNIAKAEEKDLAELRSLITNLECLNSEDVKKEGTIIKTENIWQINNPIPKPKAQKKTSKSSFATPSKSNPSTRSNQIPQNLENLKNLEITTDHISASTAKSYKSETIMGLATVLICLLIKLVVEKKSKAHP